MSEWGRIAVGTRLEKVVENRFVRAWSELITRGLRRGDGFLIAADLPAHKASNELVRRFLRTDCDSLLMLDSDADVGPGFVSEMRDLEAGHAFDVLQAFYVRRGWPPEAIWFQLHGDDYVNCLVTADNITVDVAGIGTHAVLIRRGVFDAMARGHDPETFEWFWYPRGEKMSEDLAFSQAARAAGFRLGATTAVKAGHISRVTTGWETYQEYIAINGVEHQALADAKENGMHVDLYS